MTTTTTSSSVVVAPPIPAWALEELERRGARVAGWDDCPPQIRPPVPVESDEGDWFDVEAVWRAIRALRAMRHTKGKWAGTPLDPEPFQVVWIIAPVFGWMRADGTRRYRTCYVEIPRKNGKSTISSGFALILVAVDGEPGAEVYAAASTLGQAEIVYGEARKMVLASPLLRKRLRSLKGVIEHPRSGSVFRALSKVSDAAHGLNVHGAVVDELHVHKRRDLVDVIETGTGARDQPLVVIITTADEGTEFTIYAEKRSRAERIANGVIVDLDFYGIVWAAAADADPFAEATWRSCNPGFEITVKRDYLAAKAQQAKEEPSFFPVFCRLHLNRRMRSEAVWFSPEVWDRNAGPVTETVAALRGRAAWGGLDLSATTDLTSLMWLVAPAGDADDPDHLDVLVRYWLPEDNVEELERRLKVPLRQWADAGFLELTPGEVIDYSAIRRQAREDASVLAAQGIAFDRMFAGQLVQELAEDEGITVWPTAQTYLGLSPGAKELERLARAGRLRHGAHPVLRWNALEVRTISDGNDNIRPIKPDRSKSASRVDGISAGVMAMSAFVRREREQEYQAYGWS